MTGSTTHAATYSPADAAGFTNVLNTAVLGDTIVLTAGTTYTGSFTLPNKPTGSGYITIQSSALGSLPAAGTRIATTNAPSMPKIRAPGSNLPALTAAVSAHHYKFIGIEIIGPSSGDLFQLITLGTSGASQDTLAEVPNNFIFERCIVRANSSSQGLLRGIGLNSASTDIVDSRIEGCKWIGADSQAICGWNGPGPFNIINNYLEGAGENVMFGGADATITNLVPSDIIIRRNHFFKPLSWYFNHPSYAGQHWSVKNLFELKNARRVTIEDNILENHWVDAQSGPSILFTVRSQSGTNPWAVVEDCTFRNNIVRHSAAGVSTLGTDNLHPSGKTQRLRIENNLFYDIGGSAWGGNGRLFQILSGTDFVTINHNTAFMTAHIIVADGAASQAFVYTNNLTPHNEYGVFGSGAGVGNPTFTQYFPGCVFTKNVLMGGPANSYSNHPGSFFPTSWTGVLNNHAGGNFANGDWNVVNGSIYDNTGTDGKDIGADIPAILTATAGCITGVWDGGPPPPPPPATAKAYDGFAYTGGLNGQNGGTGFANAWTAVAGATNPTLAAGSLAYTNGALSLVTTGNKLQPAANSRSTRNFTTAIPTANTIQWVAFRVNQTGKGKLPTNQAGFSLFSGAAGTGTEILLGKPANGTNWGITHSGTSVQSSGQVKGNERNVFLVYKLVFTSSQVTISMWVNPALSEASLGAPKATLTKAHTTSLSSLGISTGANSTNYQLDEFRIGSTFSSVAPTN